MKGYKLGKPETMLLALMNASLNNSMPNIPDFETASPNDWQECCNLAIKQGVMALAWDGILTLPKEHMPPQDLKIAWALAVEKYEKKYEYYCQIASELSEFYSKHGIRMVQLKGVGLSTYYNVPSHREGGDIDIYCYSADKNKLSDKDAYILANKLMEDQGIDVDYAHSAKHSIFCYKGIPIENHSSFLDIDKHQLLQKAELILKECIDPQSVKLLTGKSIQIPSLEFNTLFVVIHAANHYGYGMSLHHLYDWASIIKKHGMHFPKEFHDKHFMQGVNALNHLCSKYFGISVPKSDTGKLSDKILEEILDPFNIRKFPDTGILDFVCFKIRRFIHMILVENTFFYTPLWRSKRFWNKLAKAFYRNI